jgi:hypothetical protein
MMIETSNLTDALRGEKTFRRQVAPFQRPLDKPARCPYNAASSEGKSSGTDAAPVNGAAEEHQAGTSKLAETVNFALPETRRNC